MLRTTSLVLALAVALALALASGAGAATTFTVTSTGDTDDAAIDGVCNATGGGCTLRAAQSEVNNNFAPGGPPYTINIDASIQGQTISSTGGIGFTQPVTIDGCAGVGSPTGPCTGYDVTANNNGFTFFQAATVRGFAISGPGTQDGIFTVTNAPSLAVENNWIGQELTGAAGGWTNGVLARGDNANVGGLTASTRNVISNNSIGIRIEGDNTIVRGNYFGTNNNGTAADQGGNPVAGNTTSISVTRANVGDPAPVGTVIGGTLDAGAASTIPCDGACNLISRGTLGLDLDGPSGFPAGATTIAGNYLGLDVGGTTALENSGSSIEVGQATGIVVGGSSASDRNVFAGGARGIFHNGIGGLTVRNNFFGMNAAGTAALPATSNAIVVGGNAANPAIVRDNRLTHAAGTGSAMELSGASANVRGNIFGVGTGGQDLPMGANIRVTGNDNVIGGTGAGDANVLGRSMLVAAIGIDGGDGNQVLGNLIGVEGDGTPRPNFGGVRIRFNNTVANNNVIGGDTAAAENKISNSVNDAIVITGAGTGNRVFGNNGSNNGGQFLDIGGADTALGDGGGNSTGANGNVPIPPNLTATTLGASGTGAEPNATVRVFTTPSVGLNPPSALGGLVGTATADGMGNWSVTYSSPLPNDTPVTANQTSANSSSELTLAAISADKTLPETTINSGPSGTIVTNTPQFTFSSNEAGTFECAVDSGGFSACTSGSTIGPLADGQHTFNVRAIDGAANVDASPATRTFSVDTTAPDTTFTSGPEGPTNSPPQFGLGSEAGATFECRVDGGAFGACDSPYSPGVLADGPHTVEARAKDAAGNVDPSPASRSFTVDTAPPDTAITSGPSGATNVAPQFAFESEAGASFECSLDAGPFGPCTTPYAPPFTDGQRTLAVRAKDAAGNVDPSPATRSFLLDTQVPETSVTGGPSGPTRDSTPTFTLFATGTTLFECRLDGGEFSSCPGRFTTPRLGDGAHTLEVRGKDEAGNVDATPAKRSFTVDTTGPAVRINPRRPEASDAGVIKLRITCPKSELGARCTGKVRLLRKKAVKAARFSVARGRTKVVKLQLTAAAIEQLASDGVLPVTASAAARDPLGNQRTVKRELRVRP